ncbi:MAG TPA: ABC transporter ATP-binding protein [Gemmatimonadales bacterium]|nr:ABC transporter ATP-binding protein [Gemmatimonadales bacterium]
MTAPPALALRGIRKQFGPVQALRGADFTLMPGELHALLGENGAGKTTLMHMAYGLARPDAGTVTIDGVMVSVPSPRAARRLGVGMVHQHFTSVPALSVAENVALAAGWPVRPGALRERVRALAEQIGLPLEPDTPAGRLSVGLKQRLEIVKALATDVRVLLLDEPTAVLAPGEAEDMLRVVRAFTARGGSAVLITHKLDEALAVADRVTVLRQGVVVHEGAVADETQESLAAAMIGRGTAGGAALGDEARPVRGGDDSSAAGEQPATPSRVLVRLEELEVPRDTGYGIAVRRASLAIRGGEIVGIVAVEGNGQRELLRAVAGRLHPLRGRREVAGPVGFIPEDRTTEGLIPSLSLTENLVLGSRPDDPWIRRGRVDWRVARACTAALLAEYEVVAPGPDVPAAALSGGNQQKVVVARELARQPRVVVAENPTRGLDLRAAAAIQRRLRDAAAGGAAVLVYSSDLDEVLALADRILVAARGTLIEPAPGATRAQVGELMVTGGL